MTVKLSSFLTSQYFLIKREGWSRVTGPLGTFSLNQVLLSLCIHLDNVLSVFFKIYFKILLIVLVHQKYIRKSLINTFESEGLTSLIIIQLPIYQTKKDSFPIKRHQRLIQLSRLFIFQFFRTLLLRTDIGEARLG